ncbi:ACP S-malonyltransferase [Fodinicurvata sp. EGI_FJ10296]|uniref:ACP S-malonyltransferase n=1 Tax=Fodinicurvata sp. EGI_FJ10296 TaxID=3231908 RepID=UPI003451C012
MAPPSRKIAFLFPGQGAQAKGVASAYREAFAGIAERFEQAASITGIDVDLLTGDRAPDVADATDIVQPAIFTLSTAIAAELAAAGVRPAVAAGHSLGELSALTAAGALSFEQGVALVALRGRLMREAGDRDPGTMSSVMGLDEAEIDAVLGDLNEAVWPANLNGGGQIVISGRVDAVARAGEALQSRGGAIRPLSVSGSFHTPLLAEAGETFARAVTEIEVADPSYPVISNITAEPLTTAADIRAELAAHMTSRVRWGDSVEAMRDAGIDTFVEVGPGKVLSGLAMRIDRNLRPHNTQSVAFFQRTLEQIGPE